MRCCFFFEEMNGLWQIGAQCRCRSRHTLPVPERTYFSPRKALAKSHRAPPGCAGLSLLAKHLPTKPGSPEVFGIPLLAVAPGRCKYPVSYGSRWPPAASRERQPPRHHLAALSLQRATARNRSYWLRTLGSCSMRTSPTKQITPPNGHHNSWFPLPPQLGQDGVSPHAFKGKGFG